MLHEGLIQFIGTPVELQQSDDPIVQEFIERYAMTNTARGVGEK
jgi:hypothetical protein